MIDLEKYKNNLDIIDNLGIKDVPIKRKMICDRKMGVIDENKTKIRQSAIPPMAATVLGVNNTAAPLPINEQFTHSWTDIDAQEMFLNSKPSCFLILSKPGAGSYTLGEAISKKYNCIHLCPRNIIIDEIEQCSSTGKCIEFNMKHYNALKFEAILPILKKKLESAAVQHQGYIISGLPFVSSSRHQEYLFNKLHSEEALETMEDVMYDLICNLKRKKPKKTKMDPGMSRSSISSDQEMLGREEEQSEEEQEPEAEEEEAEEPTVALPKFILDPCSNIILSKLTYSHTMQFALLQQMNFLFNLPMQPDYIIYITCPDIDLVTKKNHKFLNYKNNMNIIEPFFTQSVLELRWPQKYSTIEYAKSYNSHAFNPKYACRQPINFIENSIEQVCNYKKYILPFIQRKIKEFNPMNIVKVDARISINKMMHLLSEIFISLPIRPVFIPEPLYLEESPEDMDEFWKIVEGLNVIRDGVIYFKRYPSRWFNRCPVELKKRQSVQGNPRFAVSFLKHVYLTSSLKSMISFCRNPRPYLKIKYLEPTCRVIIIGTKSSGKTMISKCLSWIFDAPIICYKTFLENEKKKKYEAFSRSIFSEIIATIEDARFEKWQSIEIQRVIDLDTWYNGVLPYLNEYIPLLIENINYTEKQKEKDMQKAEQTFENEEEAKVQTGHEVENLEFLERFNNLQSHLTFLPFIDDIEMCENAAGNKDFLLQHGPVELITPTAKPAIPVLGDNDVTDAISAYIVTNDLQKEIEPSIEELMAEIIIIISNIDIKAQKATDSEYSYGKYIIDDFPSDPEFWGFLIESQLLPDYTIALIENREIVPELAEYYTNIEKYIKNYEERFIQADDPLIQTKLLTKELFDTIQLDVEIIIHDLLNYIFESVLNSLDTISAILETDMITSFTGSVEKLREDWDTLKLRLEENSKSLIEVELENKTDIEVVQLVLLKLRNSYCINGAINEDEDIEVQDEDETPKDVLTYNHPQYLCETNIYCPIAYYDQGVLWVGKPEFSIKYDNKVHNFSSEVCLERFKKDITSYQFYNKPYKKLPPLRICVIGNIGSGKTTNSKMIAKELGLLHVDISEVINDYLMPKHFKKVGRQYENIFTDIQIDEEGVSEFQIEENENVANDILANETELRRMVYNYFERGTPIISILMQRLIKKIWFDEPFSTTGFVLDGYPRLPTDVEDMIASFCIPDLIIELEGNPDISLRRISPQMLKKWKSQLKEAKEIAEKKFTIMKKNWLEVVTKIVVVKLICDEILGNIHFDTQPLVDLSKESVLIDVHISASSQIDPNLIMNYNNTILEYPEPTDQSEWEKSEDARERIDSRIESLYDINDENIQNLKDILLEQKIKLISIDGTKSLSKILRVILFELSLLKNRCESFFEQTFIINIDTAEILLSKGFYFLSKFNRMCPVYLFENPNIILNPYKLIKPKGTVFSVIHRAYVYFIFGEDGLKKFRTNPLKYIQSNVESFTEYPLRLSVIGPPKSGRSILAKKLAKKFGLLCVSRGIAIRYILENMHWTELASKMIASLREGECINSEHIIKAVQMIAIDHRVATHGIVFDGFPELPPEAMELATVGFYPLIIFDITASRDTIIDNSQNEHYLNIVKRKPPYPRPFIDYRFSKWQDKAYGIRDWVKNDYQNVQVIDGNLSKWQCFKDANTIIEDLMCKIRYYLMNVNYKIVPAGAMCISNDIFQERMSNFKNMCPICLELNVLRHNGYPVDKNGLVQYKNKLYWICPDHMNTVLNNARCYLTDRIVEIPEIPAVVKTINNLLVYENGICIVTYAENLPAQIIIRGSNDFAANFRGKIYLFCSKKCHDKFLQKPHLYYDVSIFIHPSLPQISLNNLPHLGYLEQTMGNIITDACCSVNVTRPKYPGLDIKLSALLYIALYLKSHNPLFNESNLLVYENAFKVYEARCKLMISIGLRLRSMNNPFMNYPRCCDDKKINKDNSGTVSKLNASYTSTSTVSRLA